MSRRHIIRAVVTALLAGIVLFGMIAGNSGPRDRVRAITSRLKCPVCQGESVADSPSDVSRQIVAQVQDQVSQGWTDAQIEQYFVDRYGSNELLDPPPSGRNLVLWLVPPLIFAGGVLLVQRKVTSPNRRRLRVGSVVALAACGAVLLVVFRDRSASDPSSAAAPPPTTQQATDTTTRDLSTVTNDEMETVISQNPTVVGMRLAIIKRYIADGEIDKALRHSAVAVEMQSTPAEYEQALQLHGWVTFLHGEPASGAKYLRASLALAPDDRDSLWLLAQVELNGLKDPQSSLTVLDRLIGEQMDVGRRTDVLSLLNVARKQLGLAAVDLTTAMADATRSTTTPAAPVTT